MILGGANGAFRRVTPVNALWGQLECDAFVGQEVFEGVRAFVVHHDESGAESGTCQACVQFFVRFKQCGSLAISYWFHEDRI